MFSPVFVFLIILAAIALWFLLFFTYRAIGKLFNRIYKNSKKNKIDEDEEE